MLGSGYTCKKLSRNQQIIFITILILLCNIGSKVIYKGRQVTADFVVIPGGLALFVKNEPLNVWLEYSTSYQMLKFWNLPFQLFVNSIFRQFKKFQYRKMAYKHNWFEKINANRSQKRKSLGEVALIWINLNKWITTACNAKRNYVQLSFTEARTIASEKHSLSFATSKRKLCLAKLRTDWHWNSAF